MLVVPAQVSGMMMDSPDGAARGSGATGSPLQGSADYTERGESAAPRCDIQLMTHVLHTSRAGFLNIRSKDVALRSALQRVHLDPAGGIIARYVKCSFAVQIQAQLNAGHAAPHPGPAHQPPSTATTAGTQTCTCTAPTGGDAVQLASYHIASSAFLHTSVSCTMLDVTGCTVLTAGLSSSSPQHVPDWRDDWPPEVGSTQRYVLPKRAFHMTPQHVSLAPHL